MCKGSGGIGLHLASIRKQSVSAVWANKIAAVVSCYFFFLCFPAATAVCGTPTRYCWLGDGEALAQAKVKPVANVLLDFITNHEPGPNLRPPRTMPKRSQSRDLT